MKSRGKLTKCLSMLFAITIIACPGSAFASSQIEGFFTAEKLAELKTEEGAQDLVYTIDAENEEGGAKAGNGWKTFNQTVGNEHLTVQFPDKPIYTRMSQTWGATISLLNQKEYWMMAPVPAAAGVQEEELFPQLIDLFSQAPYQMIDYDVGNENGHPTLDITSYHEKTRKTEKIKVVVTDKNFYILDAKFKKSDLSDETPFLNSLAVQ